MKGGKIVKILARHKWVSGAVITESVDEKKEGYSFVSYRRFTANIRGYQNWKIWEGYLREEIVEKVIETVSWIRDEIDKGNEEIFKMKGYFLIEPSGIECLDHVIVSGREITYKNPTKRKQVEYTESLKGGHMREKIAKFVERGIEQYKISNRQISPILIGRVVADQILSLPVEGCDCTLGELSERARKMKEVLIETHGYADKFINKCETGRARSTETQKDMRTLRNRIKTWYDDAQKY